MRISTNQISEQAVRAMQEGQLAVLKTQLQLSEGKRILTPSDDPAGSAQVANLGRMIDTTEQYQKNADAAQARLGLAENTLSDVNQILQRVRELAVQANNDSQSAESRGHIAGEVRQRLGELLAAANTRDGSNEYLFAGFQGLTTPFAANGAGGFNYYGDQGQRFLQIGPGQTIATSDSGAQVFQRIANGNGTYATFDDPANTGSAVIVPQGVNGAFVPDVYTIAFSQAGAGSPITYTVTGAASGAVASGTYAADAAIAFNGVQLSFTGTPANGDRFTVRPAASEDMFTILQSFAGALETTSGAGLHNAMNRTLSDLDQALGKVLDQRAVIGARLNALQSQVDVNSAITVQMKASLSQVQDLDYAEAASRLSTEQAVLEAAQRAFVRTQGLSLFQLL